VTSGFLDEAKDWRRWLLRAAAGEPSKLQIMYGLHGERRLTELTLPWLCGYEHSQPVRIGNAGHTQVQLDVYGELMDTMHVARKFKLEPYEEAWALQKAIVKFVSESWHEPITGSGRFAACAALYVFEGDGLGRTRSHGQERGELRPGRSG
jgi:GH15 family glucan-1,4-alpha-glucosidase